MSCFRLFGCSFWSGSIAQKDKPTGDAEAVTDAATGGTDAATGDADAAVGNAEAATGATEADVADATGDATTVSGAAAMDPHPADIDAAAKELAGMRAFDRDADGDDGATSADAGPGDADTGVAEPTDAPPVAVDPPVGLGALPPPPPAPSTTPQGYTRLGNSLLLPPVLLTDGVKPPTTLLGCLSTFTAPELLRVATGDGYRCTTCNDRAKAEQEARAAVTEPVSGEVAAAPGVTEPGVASSEAAEPAAEGTDNSEAHPSVTVDVPGGCAGAGAPADDTATPPDEDDGWTEVRRGRSRSNSGSQSRSPLSHSAGPAPPPVTTPDTAAVLRNATKRILFYSPPAVLTMHLKVGPSVYSRTFLCVSHTVPHRGLPRAPVGSFTRCPPT